MGLGPGLWAVVHPWVVADAEEALRDQGNVADAVLVFVVGWTTSLPVFEGREGLLLCLLVFNKGDRQVSFGDRAGERLIE